MEDKIRELLSYYFKDHSHCKMKPVPFGLTNLTRIIEVNDVKYIARIYNRHTKSKESLELEARITSYLNHANLSFQVPAFLSTHKGDEYVELPDGTLGVMVSFIEGSVPALSEESHAAEFGRVVGEMSAVLSTVATEKLAYKGQAFSNFYSLHPLADRDAVQTFFAQPPFSISDGELTFYTEMVESIESAESVLNELPWQLVHHDLLVFNLLTKNHHICGVLDFDFIAMDARCMELAICLNHVLQLTDGSWRMLEAFVKSYAAFCKSSAQEIVQLRHLTRIYHIALLHIYIGQHYAGVPIESNFTYILNQFRDRDRWLKEHEQPLKTLLDSYWL
ncbi:phosphotransferase enzyme family protein [Paenibacillus sp. NPDC057967]|uniref:phosphotransferase enzyme family protein n=1 Tax=Paenibacillus sp. NPDC057967 TaxID=3346293 RepID=UPI0036D83410